MSNNGLLKTRYFLNYSHHLEIVFNNNSTYKCKDIMNIIIVKILL
jgi:hypothetical protein